MNEHIALRLVVVDDEPAARQRLRRLAEELGGTVVGECANGLEALRDIEALRPDVVLLDVEMPEIDGLDVARRLPDPRPFVIFATAYEHYAPEAFDAEALDFVVKPVSAERLARALDRARRRRAEAALPSRLDAATLASVAAAIGRAPDTAAPRRILVRHLNGHRLVALRDVLRFRAEDNAVYAVQAAGEALVEDTLDELERRLGQRYVRVNRQELLAIDGIDRLVSNGDGSARVTTRAGTEHRVSRRRAAAVREALKR